MSRARNLEQILGIYNDLLREMAAHVVASEKGDAEREPWLSVEQAAAYAGVEPGTIYKWIERGDLRVGRHGKLMRIRASDIDVLLTEAPIPSAPRPSAEAIVRQISGGKRAARRAS